MIAVYLAYSLLQAPSTWVVFWFYVVLFKFHLLLFWITLMRHSWFPVLSLPSCCVGSWNWIGVFDWVVLVSSSSKCLVLSYVVGWIWILGDISLLCGYLCFIFVSTFLIFFIFLLWCQSAYPTTSCNLAPCSWNGCYIPRFFNIFTFPGQHVCKHYVLSAYISLSIYRGCKLILWRWVKFIFRILLMLGGHNILILLCAW